MISFSPGLALGCFDLLNVADRNKLTFQEISLSFAYFDGIECVKVLNTAQQLNWLQKDEWGIAAVSPAGLRLLRLSGYQAMLSQALLDYVQLERPPWIQNATFGRMRVIAFANYEVAQVFVEAGLTGGTDDEVVAFWDALAAQARGQKNDRLTAIGRQGERFSLRHEEQRTGKTPRWISVDDNADGYDVLSIVSPSDGQQLSIEVKTTTVGTGALFHLTRNEWERAIESSHHCFHLWDLATANSPRLATVFPEMMKDHIPTDCGSGTWESVAVAFSAFNSSFSPCNFA